jgi:hypothetical protein
MSPLRVGASLDPSMAEPAFVATYGRVNGSHRICEGGQVRLQQG